MRIEVDDPQQFGFPLRRHGRYHARCFARREGGDPTLEKAFEHALDGIAAAEHHGGNLGHRAPLLGQQDYLVAQTELGIGGGIVQLSEFGDLGVGQRR
jgi:hypothetical protein